MKWLAPLLVLLAWLPGEGPAQTPVPTGIINAEYFWDADPGPGNGTAIIPSDGLFGESVENFFGAGVTPPATPGPHTFNLRVRTADLSASQVFTTVVHILPPPTSPAAAQSVGLSEAEYFWDIDPGEGSGTPFLASDGAFEVGHDIVGCFIAVGVNCFHAFAGVVQDYFYLRHHHSR